MARFQDARELQLWKPEVKMILYFIDLSVERNVEKRVEKQPGEVEVKKPNVPILS